MNRKVLILITAIVVYIASCFGSYGFVRYCFTEKWKGINPGAMEYVIVFCPGVNTMSGICYIFKGISSNDFFGIPNR